METKQPLLFLSHSGGDSGAARELAAALRRAGVRVWLDVEELRPGDRWMDAVEAALAEADGFAVYVGRAGTEGWVGREVRVALERSTASPDFRVIPILGPGADPDSLPYFLSQHQWLDLRQGFAELANLKVLVASLLSLRTETVSLLAAEESPFRGLLPFDTRHAHLFFGRDREIDDLLHQLARDPFLAITGSSGSGKSSLVRAGLIPALHQRRFQQDGAWVEAWRIVAVRPRSEPFREVASALVEQQAGLSPADRMRRLEEHGCRLESGDEGLARLLAETAPADSRTLLVVDQFEELFTQVPDEAERHRFIDSLLRAANAAGSRPVHVLITLRADFYSHCWQHPELPDRIAGNQYAVRSIRPDRLREVIEKPAALAGARLEPGLVEAMLHDAGDESGNLALLEHALTELWERRADGVLTHASYDGIGRLEGALEHRAEEVYGGLDRREQRLARRIFLRLTEPGEGTGATRRRVRRQPPADPQGPDAALERVLDRLVRQRLVTVGQEPGEESEEIELAHEALIRGWRRLRRWLEADREFLLWRRRLHVSLDSWQEAGREEGALLRGGPLAEAERWLGERRDDLDAEQLGFIEASIARRRRSRRLKAAVTAALALLAIAAAVGGVVALRQSRLAAAEAAASRATADFLIGLFEVADPKSGEGRTVTARDLLDRGAERLPQELSAQPATRAALQDTIGTVYSNLGLYEEAQPHLEAAVATRREHLGADHPRTAMSLGNLATLHQRRGAYAEAEELYRQALASQRRALGEEHPEIAQTLNDLAVVYMSTDRYEEAGELHRQALEMRRRTVGEENESVAQSLLNLGGVYHYLADSERAEEHYRQAMRIFDAAGAESPQAAVAASRLGWLHGSQGRYDEAEELYLKALAIQEKRLEPLHPDLGATVDGLAVLYDRQGRFEEAEPWFLRGLEMGEKILGPDHPDMAFKHANVGIHYKKRALYEDSKRHILRSLELLESDPGLAETVPVGVVLHNLAELRRAQGKVAQAEATYRRSDAILRRSLDSGHPAIADNDLGLANLYRDSGRMSEAEPLYRRALASHRQALGADHPKTAESRRELAAFLRAAGRAQEAAALEARESADGP